MPSYEGRIRYGLVFTRIASYYKNTRTTILRTRSRIDLGLMFVDLQSVIARFYTHARITKAACGMILFLREPHPITRIPGQLYSWLADWFSLVLCSLTCNRSWRDSVPMPASQKPHAVWFCFYANRILLQEYQDNYNHDSQTDLVWSYVRWLGLRKTNHNAFLYLCLPRVPRKAFFLQITAWVYFSYDLKGYPNAAALCLKQG